MEIHQIKHFIAIVETGSFTKGADRAAVTQSTISISIAKLEAEFGVQLLERRSPVVPTGAGERLVEVGKAILQLCSVVKGELETIAKPKLLRIGILQSLSSRHVSRLLGSFRRDNPLVAIEMFDGVGEQLIGLLNGRRVDAILTIFATDAASKFPSRVLFEEPYVLAVPESHRFAQRKSVKLSGLRGEPFIVRARRDLYHDVTDALNSHGVEPQEERQARLPELRQSIARFSRNLAEAAWHSALQQALAQRLSGAPAGRTGAAR